MPDKMRPLVHLPRNWPRQVRSAVLQAIFLAHFSLTCVRSLTASRRSAVLGLRQENDRLRQEINLLGEEMHLKDDRMERLPTQRRPHYHPIERLAILELRATRGWSLDQTAERMSGFW